MTWEGEVGNSRLVGAPAEPSARVAPERPDTARTAPDPDPADVERAIAGTVQAVGIIAKALAGVTGVRWGRVFATVAAIAGSVGGAFVAGQGTATPPPAAPEVRTVTVEDPKLRGWSQTMWADLVALKVIQFDPDTGIPHLLTRDEIEAKWAEMDTKAADAKDAAEKAAHPPDTLNGIRPTASTPSTKRTATNTRR